MDELWNGVRFVASLGSAALFIGAGFTFGCALVCRAMEWSPVNINFTVSKGEDA